jgi:DegV family protein with EDD domain
MTDYIIATSSTSDLPRTWLEAHGVPFIPYTYSIGETVFEDDCREESRQKVYEGMRKCDFLKTAMINEFEYEEFFRSLMQEGRNVIFLDMSREMSSSFVNAGLAAENIREEFPEQTLYIMDTLCISGGLGLLVEQMVLRKEQGMGFEDVIAWGEENKLKIAHRFTVDDLNYLKAGGRVSNASALVGSLLNIKPVLYVPDKGTLDVVKKARGRKAALKSILDGVIHDLSESGAEGREIHILQADCREDAEKIRDGIKAAFPGVGNITITSLGVVIGAHCGPGLLTVFYLCGGRRPE